MVGQVLYYTGTEKTFSLLNFFPGFFDDLPPSRVPPIDPQSENAAIWVPPRASRPPATLCPSPEIETPHRAGAPARAPCRPSAGPPPAWGSRSRRGDVVTRPKGGGVPRGPKAPKRTSGRPAPAATSSQKSDPKFRRYSRPRSEAQPDRRAGCARSRVSYIMSRGAAGGVEF